MTNYVILDVRRGERGQVVKAEDCGSSTRGFESHRSPLKVFSYTTSGYFKYGKGELQLFRQLVFL